MDLANFYRRPWIIMGVLIIIIVWGWYRCFLFPVETTTVFIVRHAEKTGDTSDPPLSAAGQARAAELARLLTDEGIDAVFVTEFIRTQQTGAAVAAVAGVTPQQYLATDAQGLADMIVATYSGDRILVVGHSTTVDDIASALGASGLSDLDEDHYDRLFVVHRFAGAAHLDQLRYGAETP